MCTRARLCAILTGLALLAPAVAAAQAPRSAPPAAKQASPPETPAPPAPPAKPAAPPQQKYRTADGDLDLRKVMGSSVSNDQSQVIGTIDDILLSKQNEADRVVLSVGGFLGVGSRRVQVPFAHLKIGTDTIILPGATKVSLENLSAYQAQ